ncbi:MAG: hypothetical protein ABIR32_16910, partial [Ilumatobacteraceae bacterium]
MPFAASYDQSNDFPATVPRESPRDETRSGASLSSDLCAVAPASATDVARLPPSPFLIGVAGGTCSGKTTISERLTELAG